MAPRRLAQKSAKSRGPARGFEPRSAAGLYQARTIFDCVAYGGYSFETDQALIYRTNFNFASRLLVRLQDRDIAMYVHAGSSSEYGDNASGPKEDSFTSPNSHYAVSQVTAANLLYYYGEKSWAFPA